MSYRSYVPSFKPSLSSSYKSGSTSAYSSKDDINDSKSLTSPRFAPITSPAAYRPSYSGGTYRSIPIKRDSTYTPYKYTNEKSKDADICNHKSSRYSTSTSNLSRYGPRSRDPSPAAERFSSTSSLCRAKSREPSPISSTVRRSRDPSPVSSDVSKTSAINRPSVMNYPTYRMGQSRHPSSGYSSRIGINTSTSSASRTNGSLAERALSYMTASEMRTRAKHQRDHTIDKKSNINKEQTGNDNIESKKDYPIKDDSFVSVNVTSRSTSPTPPGTTTVTRTRRIDISKTIDKTIQRSTEIKATEEKEIQSDRLDDSTKYLRYNSNSSRSPSNSWSENRYASTPKYCSSSNSPQSRNIKSESSNDSLEKLNKKDDCSNISTTKCRNNLKKSDSKSKLSPPKSYNKHSLENVNSSLLRPPTIPKSDSSSKTSSSSNKETSKWANKDFRKSALNVGPTDRPRKSRTPSTGTDTEEIQQPRGTLQIVQTLERSSSVGSEASSCTATSTTSTDEKRRYHQVNRLSNNKSPKLNNDVKLDKELDDLTNNMYHNKIDINNFNETYENKNKLSTPPPPPPPPPNTLASAALLLKYLNINSTDDSSCVGSSSQQNENTHENQIKQLHTENDKTKLVRKLGKISSFLAAQIQEDSDDEPIIFDNNSSSNSINESLKRDGSTKIKNIKSNSISSSRIRSSQNDNNNPIITSPTDKSQTETTDNSSWWLNTSQQINTDSALDDNMKYKLRHIDSGELAWWQRNNEDDTLADDQLKTLNQDDTEFDDKTGSSSIENSWWTKNMNGSNDKTNPIERQSSGEIAWWLNNDNDESRKSSNDAVEIVENEYGEKTWWPNDTTSINVSNPSLDYYLSEPARINHFSGSNTKTQHNNSLPGMIQLNSIKRIESGESPWWLNSEKISPIQKSIRSESFENERPPFKMPNEGNIKKSASPSNVSLPWWMQNESMKKLATIKRADSGERAWWLQDEEKIDKQNSPINHINSNNKNYYEKQNESDNDDEEICQVTVKLKKNNYQINQCDNNSFHLKLPKEDCQNKKNYTFAPPLGDRASPEGLEDDSSKSRKSPYDNIPSSKTQLKLQQKRIENQKRKENLFISRHQNIDDLLGGSCRPLSPLVDLFSSKNVFLEEITPAQVRIHDSTAQMPVIQRMEGDEWINYSASTSDSKPNKPMLDDAALQIYKDGDFGAYLDLESSLGEQTEEIEGLNSSRKNSIVIRTQLSVRVHAIIEKLSTSEGSELRRALFSLKQIFQEDKDLVHGFVALGGLNCLVRVGNGADQNYQNYILRALGQVMLYVDGMNGVMKHGPTIQWLYSLISSKYRLVVKTALKLLLVFVEYIDSNSYLLVNAIHAIDKSNNAPLWSNIMKLLKDYENADTELLIYATSLINKTLSGLSDQDSFYDESDLLEQQGMEGVIQRYMSRPGTDLDLLDQLQLYEAVLKFEDGEADGICLPDNSIRKTLRYRSSNDTAERRKSRRHSTGLSPMQQSTPNKLLTSPNGVLDEDSSSSSNSNEFSNNNGVFRECKGIRDGAGVTPGLRRRRERAERQKSFMREQQEVGMNFGFYENNKTDQNGELGQCQIVTAVPVHLKNGDSPPDSLTSLNSNSPEHEEQNNLSLNSSYISPAKSLLNNTSISVINSNGFNKNQQQNRINSNNEFQVNKNKIIHSSSSTVINGLMKNLQYNENMNGSNVLENINGENFLKNKNYLSQTSTGRTEFSNHLNEMPNNMKNSNYPVNSDSNGNQIINNNGYNHSNCIENGLVNGNNQKIETDVITSIRVKPNELLTRSQQQKITQQLLTSEMNINNNNTGNLNSPPKVNSTNINGNVYGNNSHTIGSPITTVINGNSNNLNINTKFCATTTNDLDKPEDDDKKLLLQLKRDQTVKDLTQKLSNLPTSPQEDKPNRIGDMTGLISKAKEGLAKSKSRGDMSRSSSVDQDQIKKSEPKKSENELHWEELVKNIQRPLNLCDLDFTDLNSGDEEDVLAPRNLGGGIPPPPPPSGMPPPPMLASLMPPPPTNLVPPTMFKSFNQNSNSLSSKSTDISNTIKKNKKTVKLFWKEVREDMIPQAIGKTVWDELPCTNVDTQKLEHLFESRAKDLMAKKQQELNKSKEIIVLDHKRSNAINIAMTKLPPPRAIKAAILKMDATVVTREGIDKLLNMLPTDEEKGKIQEAQMSNPELPLGSAEQFLLTLSSISELSARLRLWAFRLDFENSEKEIAEPLMDLKQGIELLKYNRTFKAILSTLLSIGIFLNGAPVKGFQIEYLAKVPEVKDTVHKHSLLHHLCHMVMETSPDTTDLYSEIGSITRASKADFTDLAHNLVQLETECKSSWDRLKLIAKHDCPLQLKQKLVDFLADCAERIILLQIVHRRVTNRYRKFLLWLGIPQHRVAESKPNEFCKIVSEFALEYRTTRERVQQQIEKKANHRERNKTRGKMIIDIPKFRSKEDRADAELKQLLGSPSPSMELSDGTLTWRRRRGIDNFRSLNIRPTEEFTDGDDEILESLVKTATKAGSNSKTTPRERKRTRHADRKSLRRTLKNGLSEEEKQHVASLIKTF